MAPGRVIAGGSVLAKAGEVVVIERSDDHVIADVHGSTTVRVELEAGPSPDWSCKCSAAANGSFCRHCVAVALTVVPADIDPDSLRGSNDEWNDEGDLSDGDDRRRGSGERTAGLRAAIDSFSIEALRDIVAEQARRDPRLKQRLLAESADIDEH